jgi:DNA-binding transcriptional MerR regulator
VQVNVAGSADVGSYRIGELARRVGLSEHVLRAWERRYQLIQPTRTPSGYRLYSTADEHRIRQMRRLVEQGIAPAEAARTVVSTGSVQAGNIALDAATARLVGASRRRLHTALLSMAEPQSQTVLDELLAVVPLETVIRHVLLPLLRELGDGWQDDQGTVAREHFATAIIGGRLASLARGWGQRSGPAALLACPSDERHDLALHMFGVLLARRGWSVNFLGADTPISAVVQAVAATQLDVVVLAASDPLRFDAVIDQLAQLTIHVRVALAGPGATKEAAARASAELLAGDPVDAADMLTARTSAF